ncbi:hypothetical protein [Candidatus Phytoplasma sacchari]
MFMLSWLVSLGAILKDYAQGFSQSEILSRRSEWMFTVWMTLMIFTGFKPMFLLLRNGLNGLNELIRKLLGLIFKRQKYQSLNRQKTLQEEKISQLETKIKLLLKEKEGFNKKIDELLNKNPKLKRSLEVKKAIPEEPSTSLEKKGDENNE